MKLKKDQKGRRSAVVSSVHSSPSSGISPSGSANSLEKVKGTINDRRRQPIDDGPFPKFFTEMLPEMNWLREVSQPQQPNPSTNFYSKTLMDQAQWMNGRQQSLMPSSAWSSPVTIPTGSNFNMSAMYYGNNGNQDQDICSPFACALTNLPLRTTKHHGHE